MNLFELNFCQFVLHAYLTSCNWMLFFLNKRSKKVRTINGHLPIESMYDLILLNCDIFSNVVFFFTNMEEFFTFYLFISDVYFFLFSPNKLTLFGPIFISYE